MAKACHQAGRCQLVIIMIIYQFKGDIHRFVSATVLCNLRGLSYSIEVWVLFVSTIRTLHISSLEKNVIFLRLIEGADPRHKFSYTEEIINEFVS